MNHSPSNFNRRDKPNAATERETLRDALGHTWTTADLASAAERAAAYLARQVLPAFDASDPRASG